MRSSLLVDRFFPSLFYSLFFFYGASRVLLKTGDQERIKRSCESRSRDCSRVASARNKLLYIGSCGARGAAFKFNLTILAMLVALAVFTDRSTMGLMIEKVSDDILLAREETIERRLRNPCAQPRGCKTSTWDTKFRVSRICEEKRKRKKGEL